MAYKVRRPSDFASGMVSSVPSNPPQLKHSVAILIQLCLSAAVAPASRPRVTASAPARVFTSDWMKALQVHQVMSATKVTMSALTVRLRIPGAKISRTRAGAALEAAAVQRSGSWMNMRTTNATAAGSRPNKSTYRQDIAGSWANHWPATSAFTKVARNRPNGAEVYNSAPASTRDSSGTTSATMAEPAAHSPPIPRLATIRHRTSCHISVTNAHEAVPSA